MKSLARKIVCIWLLMPAVSMGGEMDSPDKIAGTGPADERAAVVKVLHDYLRVTDNRDREAIAKSFHPTAFLESVTAGGALKLMTQDEWWERVSRIPANTPPRRSVVSLVEVVNAAAVARIDITDARGNASTDLFTWLNPADGWRIVNKVVSPPLEARASLICGNFFCLGAGWRAIFFICLKILFNKK